MLHGPELVDDPEAGLLARMVGRGQAREETEREVGLVSKAEQRVDQLLPADDHRDLVASEPDVGEMLPDPPGQLRGLHRIVPVVRTFSCSFRMPNISISGFGGQPGT